MKKNVLFFATLLSCFISNAQVTFVKGYMLTLTGDSVKGEVKINPKRLYETFYGLFFKPDNGAPKNYKPDKVKGYGYEGKDFLAAKWSDEMCFYKVLANGNVMLYEMLYEDVKVNTAYYRSDYYFAKAGGKEFTKIKTGKFKKQLAEIMKDNTSFIDGASEDEKNFDIEKLTQIVKQYNAWSKTK